MGDLHGCAGSLDVTGAAQTLWGNQANQHGCRFTNQLRQKIGVMFGNPETTTGGMALKFYASVQLDVRRIQSIKLGSEYREPHSREVVKNKLLLRSAPPNLISCITKNF
jgi:recombination protein RecA